MCWWRSKDDKVSKDKVWESKIYFAENAGKSELKIMYIWLIREI
ncbi:hypothetical protein PMI10_02391 [Flavobacterium sp. CF136]|nr:hypothetical protein PMI10_02391 [Flavobacterium sp. CF136]